MSIQFVDEEAASTTCHVAAAETWWRLHVASHVAQCHVVQAIRTPWNALFNVDLQVTYPPEVEPM